MTTPDPITASRERIEQQLEDACDEKWRRWGISWNKADELLFLRQALLQHEAIVKEEMARQAQFERDFAASDASTKLQ